MNNIQWGDVATWLAAIGTLGAFAVGFIQINNERRIRKRKENEEKKQEIINQAEHVSAWVAKERQSNALLSILNQSTDPIYEVIVSIVAFQGAGAKDAKNTPQQFRAFLSIAPPGKSTIVIQANYHGMNFHPGLEIAFKDNKGRYWKRSAEGEVININESPAKYYGLILPLHWQLPEQTDESPPTIPER